MNIFLFLFLKEKIFNIINIINKIKKFYKNKSRLLIKIKNNIIKNYNYLIIYD